MALNRARVPARCVHRERAQGLGGSKKGFRAVETSI